MYVCTEMKITFSFKQTVFKHTPPFVCASELVNHGYLMRCKYISFVVLDDDEDADTHLLCKMGRKISWRRFQSNTTLSHFFSGCTSCMFSWNLLSKNFALTCKLFFLHEQHFWKSSSEFMTALVATVLSIFVIQKSAKCL